MLPLLTGLLLGGWHVISGADHLAAVTPLVIERERASRIGLAWGIGHASGVWLVGLALLAIGSLIPLELVGVWSERIVGVAIVAVGLWGLWRARQGFGREVDRLGVGEVGLGRHLVGPLIGVELLDPGREHHGRRGFAHPRPARGHAS